MTALPSLAIGTGAVGLDDGIRTVSHADRCGPLGHPGCTYNPWLDKTWCLCGEVVTAGDTAVQCVACCGGPLAPTTYTVDPSGAAA